MKMTTIGLNLAKNVFQLHGVDERGRVVLKKPLKHARVLPFFAQLEPCLIGMEACGGAHHWARAFEKLGHTVKLMAPQFKPYGKTNKNDAADAEALCEAVTRPSMRFVPIKPPEQQAVLALHRARQGFVKARTAQSNQIRGLLTKYGRVIPQGLGHIAKCLPAILEDNENALSAGFRELSQRLGEHLKTLDRQMVELDRQIQRWWHPEQIASRKLAAIPGIGSQATFQRRQIHVAGHRQAGRDLFADATDSRYPRGDPGGRAPGGGSRERLARPVAHPAKPECGGGDPG